MNTLAKPLDILDIKFPVLSYDSAMETFHQWIADGSSHQVCIANVHTVMTSQKDPEFMALNNNADMVTMDGEPLRWYANLVHKQGIRQRVCGPELMLRCLEHGQQHGWKHYFYGGRQDVLDTLAEKMQLRFPEANIVGSYSPPFRSLSEQEQADIADKINHAEPHFLWVGLGAPKQERWIADNLSRINVPVQLGVGAAFDFHAGQVLRAPKIMQRCGMEWAFRAFNDPRLWKRYLETNPGFLLRLFKDTVRSRIIERQTIASS